MNLSANSKISLFAPFDISSKDISWPTYKYALQNVFRTDEKIIQKSKLFNLRIDS